MIFTLHWREDKWMWQRKGFREIHLNDCCSLYFCACYDNKKSFSPPYSEKSTCVFISTETYKNIKNENCPLKKPSRQTINIPLCSNSNTSYLDFKAMLAWKTWRIFFFLKKIFLFQYFPSLLSRKNWVFLAGETCKYYQLTYSAFFSDCLHLVLPPFLLLKPDLPGVCHLTALLSMHAIFHTGIHLLAPYEDCLTVRAVSPLRQVLCNPREEKQRCR